MDPLPYALLVSRGGLGADWGSSPVAKRCCQLRGGLEGRAQSRSHRGFVLFLLFFRGKFSSRRRPEGTVGAPYSVHGFLGEGPEVLSSAPEPMQQHSQLAGHGH